MRTARLIPHPSTPCSALEVIWVDLEREATGLRLEYRLRGDPAGLLVPDPMSGGRGDRLWEQGCCELFVMQAGEPGYREYNLAWSGQWALYGFDAYRQGRRDLDPGSPPVPQVRVEPDGLCLAARIHWNAAPRPRLALATVVQTRDGALSYWALAHPPGLPDFHHPAGFILDLEVAP